MKMIKRILGALSVSLAVSAAFMSQAMATPVVYLDPATQETTNSQATVSIWVKDLTTDVAAVGLQLLFDPAVLKILPGGFTVDPDGKMGVSLDPFNDSSTSGAGILDLFFGSDLSLDATALAANEGTSFRLATVTFDRVDFGFSLLTFANVTLSTSAAVAIEPNTENGSICMKSDVASTIGPATNCQATSVPEPGSVLLASLALGGLVLTRRRQRAA